jgi:hypothetical protein
MRLTRRTMIKSGAGVVALSSLGGTTAFAAPPALIIFDSRLAESLAFARRYSAPRIDVSREDENFWRALRAAAPDGAIIGMTSWSDLVVVRGYLEERGKRLKSETRAGNLFGWTMA